MPKFTTYPRTWLNKLKKIITLIIVEINKVTQLLKVRGLSYTQHVAKTVYSFNALQTPLKEQSARLVRSALHREVKTRLDSNKNINFVKSCSMDDLSVRDIPSQPRLVFKEFFNTLTTWIRI